MQPVCSLHNAVSIQQPAEALDILCVGILQPNIPSVMSRRQACSELTWPYSTTAFPTASLYLQSDTAAAVLDASASAAPPKAAPRKADKAKPQTKAQTASRPESKQVPKLPQAVLHQVIGLQLSQIHHAYLVMQALHDSVNLHVIHGKWHAITRTLW